LYPAAEIVEPYPRIDVVDFVCVEDGECGGRCHSSMKFEWWISDGATAVLDSCRVHDVPDALFVLDRGSRADVVDSDLSQVRNTAVSVSDGATAQLDDCRVVSSAAQVLVSRMEGRPVSLSLEPVSSMARISLCGRCGSERSVNTPVRNGPMKSA